MRELCKGLLDERARCQQDHASSAGHVAGASLPPPVVPILTDVDSSLFPGSRAASAVAYCSPWIDLCSADPLVSAISYQVLNMEVAYANFCGTRTILIPGPRHDGARGVAQYARAVLEALRVATRAVLVIHLSMYREPGLDETAELLSSLLPEPAPGAPTPEQIDLFGVWDSWHTIRTVCTYDRRLYIGR